MPKLSKVRRPQRSSKRRPAGKRKATARTAPKRRTTARKTAKRPAVKRQAHARRTAKRRAPARSAAKRRTVKRSVSAAKKKGIRIKVKLPQPEVLPWREALPGEVLVGTVEDYLTHLSVMLCTVQVPLAVGDTLHIRGFTTDLIERVASIEIEHSSVPQALSGQDIGIKLAGKVRKHDFIYKVTAPAVAPSTPDAPSAPAV